MAVQTIGYADKTYINQNAEIPDINKVTDSDMNEIKSVVNNNSSELATNQTTLSDYIGTIGWENPNPTSNISTLDVTLPSDDYDEIEIIWRLSLNNNFMNTNKIIKGYGTRLYYGNNFRPIVRNSDTSFTIQAASDSQTNTAIPLYFICRKTGLFNNE